MGRVSRIGLSGLVQHYKLDTFVEAGTGWGESVTDALAIPALQTIHSIEIDEETYLRNMAKFGLHRYEGRVYLYHGDSREVLGTIARVLPKRARVCWFMDAHFPGSGRNNPVAMLPLTIAKEDAVPLEGEVKALIASRRDFKHDVIVVDDRCLWEADNYMGGDDPSFRVAAEWGGLEALPVAFISTHQIIRNTIDNGYVICTPREEFK